MRIIIFVTAPLNSLDNPIQKWNFNMSKYYHYK